MAESEYDAVEIIYNVIELLQPVADILPVVGGVLGGVMGAAKILLPDPKLKGIIKQVKDLQKSVDSVKNDIAVLKDHVDWNSRTLPLQGHIDNIKAASCILLESVDYTRTFDTSKAESSRKDLQDMKDRLCEAVDGLLSDLTGAELKESVLVLFHRTYEGNRTKIAQIGGFLFRLALVGITTLLAIRAMESGVYGPAMLIKRYLERIARAQAYVLYYIKLCEAEVEENLARDVEKFMESPTKSENKEIALDLKMRLMDKYDWLFMYCIVFDGTRNCLRDYSFCGQCIEVHKEKGYKCASVFFLSKAKYSSSSVSNKDMARQIIQGSRDAKYAGKAAFVSKDLERREIKYWGIGCIRQNLKPWWEGEDGDKIIWQKAGGYMLYVLLQ